MCPLCHSTKAPLHNKGCDLFLNLSSLGILHGCFGEYCEDLSQASIADRRKLFIRLVNPQAASIHYTVDRNVAQWCLLVVSIKNTVYILCFQLSSPDPDLASIESVVLSTGGLNSCGLDRGSVRPTGWFSQAEGSYMLTWRNKHTRSVKHIHTRINLKFHL